MSAMISFGGSPMGLSFVMMTMSACMHDTTWSGSVLSKKPCKAAGVLLHHIGHLHSGVEKALLTSLLYMGGDWTL